MSEQNVCGRGFGYLVCERPSGHAGAHGSWQPCDGPKPTPVVSPGDLRARIEQLPRWAPMASDDGMLRAEAWMERTGIGNYVKLSDVLALLGAAQEQP